MSLKAERGTLSSQAGIAEWDDVVPFMGRVGDEDTFSSGSASVSEGRSRKDERAGDDGGG